MKKTMIDHFVDRFGVEGEYALKPDLPQNLNIELNSTCNHQCAFCEFHSPYSSYAKEMKLGVMETDFAYRILEQAWRLGIGKKEVGFYACGEPFMHKDFSKIVKYAKDLGFTYTFITSNGALATPDKMKKAVDAGLDSIRFSVNAGDKDTYKKLHGRDDFDKVVDNIKFLRKYLDENKIDMNTSISYVVTKENINQMEDFKKTFSNLVDQILFIPVLGLSDWNKELSNRLSLEQYEENDSVENKNLFCPIIFNSMYISYDGKVKLCCDTYKTGINVYDLKQELNLEKAWYSSVIETYRKAIFNKDIEGTVCENCHQLRQGVSRVMMEIV